MKQTLQKVSCFCSVSKNYIFYFDYFFVSIALVDDKTSPRLLSYDKNGSPPPSLPLCRDKTQILSNNDISFPNFKSQSINKSPECKKIDVKHNFEKNRK